MADYSVIRTPEEHYQLYYPSKTDSLDPSSGQRHKTFETWRELVEYLYTLRITPHDTIKQLNLSNLEIAALECFKEKQGIEARRPLLIKIK